MNAPAHDGGRLALMLNELRLPTIQPDDNNEPDQRVSKKCAATEIACTLDGDKVLMRIA